MPFYIIDNIVLYFCSERQDFHLALYIHVFQYPHVWYLNFVNVVISELFKGTGIILMGKLSPKTVGQFFKTTFLVLSYDCYHS